MSINLGGFSAGDKYLINYISSELVKKYDITISESLEWIKNSFLLPMLSENPLFIHHEDPDKLVKMIAKNHFPKRELVF